MSSPVLFLPPLPGSAFWLSGSSPTPLGELKPRLHHVPSISRAKRRPTRACPRCNTEKPWNVSSVDPDVACNNALVYLETELDKACYDDDDKRAGELRDKISGLQMGSYVDILNANMKFYKAFSSGSMVDIGASWLRDPKISCKHPLGKMYTGFWEVLDSFSALLSSGVPTVSPSDICISMRGSIAIVTCEENASLSEAMENDKKALAKEWNENFSDEPAAIVMSATNIFEKKNGQWYLIHHVSSPTSPLF